MTKRERIQQDEELNIKELLMFRKVINVDNHVMTLDNGTKVEVVPNEGCGGCASGGYYLDELNECDAVITSVRLDTEDAKDGEDAHIYKIFVLAANEKDEQLLLSVSGDDGNGYYGTGYHLEVTVKS